MKRVFDIMFSFIALVVFSPILVISAIAIKIDNPGPVLFRQKRIGKHFAPFFILKFRSMEFKPQEEGLKITVSGDKRVTRTGRILRKTKIDELPQLINVIKGEMSIVGPRPEVQKYVECYMKDYEEIVSVRPGITDISSIIFKDEESILGNQNDPEQFYKNIILPEKIRLAQEYVKRTSFFFDLRLILITLLRILCPGKIPGSWLGIKVNELCQ